MMRALWSGVTGLNSHQTAMDVEGHNIANVNTKGYKYDRVSFADHMSQTSRTAAGPTGNRGGTNAKQVGLGATAQAITRIFKQGSFETTEVATDLAIENDGFFILSSDGGRSFKYTRNGEFSFDEAGNFVSVGGQIVQGWMINKETGLIDRSIPVGNIVVPKGWTSEANASTNIMIKANLDSGDSVGKNIAPASALDARHGYFDKDGNKVNTDNNPTPLPPGSLPTETHTENSNADFIYDKNQNITEYGLNAEVLYDKAGEALNLRRGQGVWFSYADALSKQTITSFGNITGSLKLNGQLINIQTNIPSSMTSSSNATKIAYNTEKIAELINDYSSKTGVTATVNGAELIFKNNNRNGTTKEMKNIRITDSSTLSGAGISDDTQITAYNYKYALSSNVPESRDITGAASGIKADTTRYFTTTEDLREHLGRDIMDLNDHSTSTSATVLPNLNTNNAEMDVTMNKYGQFQITHNKDDTNSPEFNFAITSYTDDDTPENKKFTSMLQGLDGEVSQVVDKRVSANFYSSTYATSATVYDTLGTPHSIRIEYTKTDVTGQNGTEWRVNIVCAKPGKLAHEKVRIDNNDANVVTGIAKFNEFGALTSFYPSNIFFTPNNGAEANQNINLAIGSIGKFDGLTSYDGESSTSNYNTDGYPAGDLIETKINSQGVVVGAFSNGQNKELAQVAMATFVNNQGLESDGGNNFLQTSNSGDPIIGTANSGGRGNIKSGNLEMSNVDLSRSLTQLIVVQRGFQANSKTITTSDQMLNTLLQLKQ